MDTLSQRKQSEIMEASPPKYPAPHLHHFWVTRKSTPPSAQTPTESIAILGNSQIDDDLNNDEEQGEGGVVGGKKWSMDEDGLLISGWINTSTDPISGADPKKKSFWARVADHFNMHAPRGAKRRTRKTCNSRWNRCAPYVAKWTIIVEEILRPNQNRTTMEDVLSRAHELYAQRTGKTFELEFWWQLLLDQPKWKSYCDEDSVGGSSKRSKINETGGHSDTSTLVSENPAAEEGDGLSRTIGRKATKRKAMEKAANTIVELVTNQLSISGTTAVEKVDLLRQYVKLQERKVLSFEKAARLRERQLTFKERQLALKEKQWEQKLLKMNIAEMCPEDATYYGQLQEEIRRKCHQQPPSNE